MTLYRHIFLCLISKQYILQSVLESMPNASLHHESVLGRSIWSHTWSCWNHVECESLHVFTEAVLLFAARLTVDHQVRHLHSNLGLFLNFLLLSDLRLDRKKTATSCLHTLGGGKEKSSEPTSVVDSCMRYPACLQRTCTSPVATVTYVGESDWADLPLAPCCTADSWLAG